MKNTTENGEGDHTPSNPCKGCLEYCTTLNGIMSGGWPAFCVDHCGALKMCPGEVKEMRRNGEIPGLKTIPINSYE